MLLLILQSLENSKTYYEQCYDNKLDNLDKTDNFLEHKIYPN